MAEQTKHMKRDTRTTTLDRIIRAASEEFSEQGFEGARTERIARRAGVNKAALYYHLGDKETLYNAVLNVVFSDIGDSIINATGLARSPEDKLTAFITSLTRAVVEHKFLAHILAHELAASLGSMPKDALVVLEDIYAELVNILKKGTESGVFRPDIDPKSSFAMLLGGLQFLIKCGSKLEGSQATGFTYGSGTGPITFDGVERDLVRNMVAMISVK